MAAAATTPVDEEEDVKEKGVGRAVDQTPLAAPTPPPRGG